MCRGSDECLSRPLRDRLSGSLCRRGDRRTFLLAQPDREHAVFAVPSANAGRPGPRFAPLMAAPHRATDGPCARWIDGVLAHTYRFHTSNRAS